MSTYVPRHAQSQKRNEQPEQLDRPEQLGKPEESELASSLIVTGEIPEEASDAALNKIRKRRWPLVIALILAAIVISGAVTYFVLASQALEREANRTAGYDALNEAIALIQESDPVVITLDETTVAEVTEADLTERQALLDRLPTTLETLNSAEEYAEEAAELMTSDDDKAFAQQVIDAAVNRKDMLTSGEAIITKDIEAMQATLTFSDAWELIISADTEFRATTELSRTGNLYNLQEAIERNQVVVTTLEQATQLLSQAHEEFSEADFSSIQTYLTFKSESVTLAIAADEAVINGDLETVNIKNAEFSLKDAEVVEAAGLIPENPLSLITDAYESSTAEDRAQYDSARATVADADGYIREYVGVETQTAVQ